MAAGDENGRNKIYIDEHAGELRIPRSRLRVTDPRSETDKRLVAIIKAAGIYHRRAAMIHKFPIRVRNAVMRAEQFERGNTKSRVPNSTDCQQERATHKFSFQ